MISRKPMNFTWVDEGKLAAFGCPSHSTNLQYLLEHNIIYLVETVPPASTFPGVKWREIKIPEFHPPTMYQVTQFIDTCEEAFDLGKAVGVHCRMGRGRTGVMAACYLVKFHNKMPKSAMDEIRMKRPGSIETYSQEEAVMEYYFYLLQRKSQQGSQ